MVDTNTELCPMVTSHAIFLIWWSYVIDNMYTLIDETCMRIYNTWCYFGNDIWWLKTGKCEVKLNMVWYQYRHTLLFWVSGKCEYIYRNILFWNKQIKSQNIFRNWFNDWIILWNQWLPICKYFIIADSVMVLMIWLLAYADKLVRSNWIAI